ncbi:hypothetical protein GCM10009827_097140 [Dactylosporangium maewongense]|uniref:CHAT domain-containing protein n=1 Tax=Dactylosporangium maewongense TaxID=634393 RepID=A0ABP4NGR5_9ACTN
MNQPVEAMPGYLGRLLDDRGTQAGTVFQLRPGILVTAWDPLDAIGCGSPGNVCQVRAPGSDDPRPATVHAVDELRNLAVLTCASSLAASAVGLAASASVRPGSVVVAGSPPRLAVWQGRVGRADQVGFERLYAPGVIAAMAGAPVRRPRDDRVVGVLTTRSGGGSWTRLRDTVWVAPVEDIVALLDGLADVTVTGDGALDALLSIDDTTVRLTAPDVDVSAGHRGVRPGLRNALHDMGRERSRYRPTAEVPGTGGAPEIRNAVLRRAGTLLARSFLPPVVSDALAALVRGADAQQAALRLAIDAGPFAELPWEAMPEPGSAIPLALHPRVSVYRQGPAREPAPLPGPLRIVAAVAAPDGPDALVRDHEREVGAVFDAVREARHDAAQVVVVPYATTAAIRAALDGRVHVLHLSAHGAPGVLMLEDEEGAPRLADAATLLAEAIPPGAVPPVIALAACSSGVVRENFGLSFAAELTARGAHAVIATQTAVSDPYTTRVFAHVYAQLAAEANFDVVAAFTRARRLAHEELAGSPDPADRRLADREEWSAFTIVACAPEVPVVDVVATRRELPPPVPDVGWLLARPVGEFVGRRDEQRRLPALLERDATAGMVLHGIGGVGKTTLAAELVRRCSERFPKWLLVTCVGAVSVEQVLSAIAQALQVDGGVLLAQSARALLQGNISWQERFDRLRREVFLTTAVLLVLDGFDENLVPAGDGGWEPGEPVLAALLAEWVKGPGRSRVLITSRHRFSLPGGVEDRLHWHDVGPLPGADAGKLLRSLSGLGRYADDADARERIWRAVGGHPRALEYADALLAGGLGRFVDVTSRLRAAATQQALAGDRDLDGALADAVALAADDARVAHLIDGLERFPGAAELLAGISVYRTPVDDDALLFQVGTPTPGQNRTALAAAITDVLQSHRLRAEDLPAALARTERLAAAFAGTGWLPAADRERVGRLLTEYHESRRPPFQAQADLPDLLSRLITSGLVTRVPEGLVMTYPWVSAVLQERLRLTGRPLDVGHAHRAAARYWRWRVEVRPQDPAADLRDLQEARHHLFEAADADAAAEITEHICAALHARGAWDLEKSLLLDTLDRLPADAPRRPLFTGQLGVLAQERGNHDEADRWYRQALDGLLDRDDEAGVAGVRRQLGALAQARGSAREAEDWYRAALQGFEAIGDVSGQAGVRHQLGLLAHAGGRERDAVERYHAALLGFEELDDRAGEAAVHHQLGVLAQGHGRLDEAQGLYERAVRTTEELGDRPGLAAALHQLAALASERGEADEAGRRLQESLDVLAADDDRSGAAAGQHLLGVLAQQLGDYDEAAWRYDAASGLAGQLSDRVAGAAAAHQRGVVAHLHGDHATAERWYLEALRTNDDASNLGSAGHSRYQLGRLAHDLGNLGEAEEHHRAAAETFAGLGRWALATRSHVELARLANEHGDSSDARRRFNRAREHFESLEDWAGVALTLIQLGRLAQQDGHSDLAERYYAQALGISQRLDDPLGTAIAETQLALLAEDDGDLTAAVRRQVAALTIRADLDIPDAVSNVESLVRLRARLGAGQFDRQVREHFTPASATLLLDLIEERAALLPAAPPAGPPELVLHPAAGGVPVMVRISPGALLAASPDRVQAQLRAAYEQAERSILAVAESVAGTIARLAGPGPTSELREVRVEFGVHVSADGQAELVRGTAPATLTVTLTHGAR